MMKVLVVHDRIEVQKSIIELFRGLDDRELLVDSANDCVQTRRKLNQNIYDLMVIDLTVPQVFNVGGPPGYQNVRDLLAELLLSDDLNTPGDIIGITKDLEAAELISSSIGEHVMVTIEEDGECHWKQKLIEKFRYVSSSAYSRQAATNARFDFDCIILTALDKELVPFEEMYDISARDEIAGLKEFSFRDKLGISRRGLLFSIGRAGSVFAASHTQSLLALFRPKLMILAGICAGAGSSTAIKLGNLVIATSSVEWDYGKWKEEKSSQSEYFAFRPAQVEIPHSTSVMLRSVIGADLFREPSTLKELRQKTEGKIQSFEFHLAPVACGSSVIDSKAVRDQILKQNDSLRGIDMESYGFYYAARDTHVVKPQYLCAKAVVDYADGNKKDTFHPAGCQASAYFTRLLIEKFWDFEE